MNLASVEQMRRRRRAKLNGIAVLDNKIVRFLFQRETMRIVFVGGRGSCTLSSLPRKLSSGLSRVPSSRFCVDYMPFILICYEPDIASGILGRGLI